MSVSHATTLVVNPSAGRGRAARVLPDVLGELLRGLPEGSLEVLQASTYAEARRFCDDAVCKAKTDPDSGSRLVVMGGDGMMHLGLNAAGGTDVPLGLIPAGTGNDICRGVGIPLNPVKAAKIIVDGLTKPVDLASVVGDLSHGTTQRYVGSVIATGYDARVSARGSTMPTIWGPLTYAIAALLELRKFEPVTYRLRIDGVERDEQTAMFVAVSNGGYYGGGMHVAPSGSITDGLLDLTVVHPVSRTTLLRLLPKMFNGTFVKDPAVERLQATEVVVDGDGLLGMADGETLGQPPLGIVCEPSALTVFTPPVKALAKRRKAA